MILTIIFLTMSGQANESQLRASAIGAVSSVFQCGYQFTMMGQKKAEKQCRQMYCGKIPANQVNRIAKCYKAKACSCNAYVARNGMYHRVFYSTNPKDYAMVHGNFCGFRNLLPEKKLPTTGRKHNNVALFAAEDRLGVTSALDRQCKRHDLCENLPDIQQNTRNPKLARQLRAKSNVTTCDCAVVAACDMWETAFKKSRGGKRQMSKLAEDSFLFGHGMRGLSKTYCSQSYSELGTAKDSFLKIDFSVVNKGTVTKIRNFCSKIKQKRKRVTVGLAVVRKFIKESTKKEIEKASAGLQFTRSELESQRVIDGVL